jgi:RNA polymerase sigma factor (sigma-70 family)
MDQIIPLIREYCRALDPEAPERGVEKAERAAERLAEFILPGLRAFVFGSLRAKESDDVVQMTIMAVLQGICRFRGRTEGQFWGWCHQIARNKLSNSRRHSRDWEEEGMDPHEIQELVQASAPNVPITPGEKVDLEYILGLVKAAKPPCVTHLQHFFIEGWDYQAIAEANQISYNAARMAVKRCLELASALATKAP